MNEMLAQFGGSPFGGPPKIFTLFFVVIFAMVIIRILKAVFKGLGNLSDDSGGSLLTETATVVAKRSEVEGSRNSTDTTYYGTFELAGAHRIEMEVSGREFGMLAEGDRGELTHQGKRFQSFARQVTPVAPPPVEEPPTRKNLLCAYCGGAIPLGQTKCVSCGWTWKPKPVGAETAEG